MLEELKKNEPGRLIVVSNRLPVVFLKNEGKLCIQPGAGGLITAMAPILKKHKGVWIGWVGAHGFSEEEVAKLIEDFEKEAGFKLVPLHLTKEEIEAYYEGFSNEIIWPLFHDLHAFCNFDPEYWRGYQKVNKKFAEKVKQVAKPSDFVWIHDYHLMLTAKYLKRSKFNARLSFFLHIPFTPLDIFMKIPWRFEILRALLDYDSIGFQTRRDMRNFIHTVRSLLGNVTFKRKGNKTIATTQESESAIGVYPISIDFKDFETQAKSQAVLLETKSIRDSLTDRKLVFSLDRLDYTKGIPYRLEAIHQFLKSYPEFHRKVNFIQVVVPSRTDVKSYMELKDKIDRLVSEINAEYTSPGWIPIHYMFHPLSQKQLLGFYRASDVALVTPIKDGMNLVCKEYIASNIETTGVLVLSEFAGAACQLKKEALLINPYDREGLAKTIYQALTLSDDDKKYRMCRLRQRVRKENIYEWLESILEASQGKFLKEEKAPEEYIPTETTQLD